MKILKLFFVILNCSVGLFQKVIYQQLEGIPGLEEQSPLANGNACVGLDEIYGYQHEEQGADETSLLVEKVIDAYTMPAFFSHIEDADASTPRSK